MAIGVKIDVPLEPAMEGPPPAKPEIYELANVASPALTTTR